MANITYKEYTKQRQDEFNALPIYWAYSDKQFEEICERLNATADDFYTSKALGGGFYLKKDADIIRAYMDKPDELPELMKDYDFAYEAILYEMGNHEYHINWDADWDVCRCFGSVKGDDPDKYFDQLGWEPQTRKAYLDARKEFYRLCDENDWW